MKKITYKTVSFYSVVENTGILFEVNNRQFALSRDGNIIRICDLYSGGGVLKLQENDILNLSDESLIEFATLYVSKITEEQFTEAISRTMEEYSFIELPLNQKF